MTGTTTGNTAHHIAAFRPQARIVALTPDPQVARRLALLWGTESLLIDQYASFDVLIYMTEREMVSAGLVNKGDLIAFTTGMPVGAGGTNVLKTPSHFVAANRVNGSTLFSAAFGRVSSAVSCVSPESMRASLGFAMRRR